MSIAKHSARNYAWMMVLEVIKAGTLFVSAHLLLAEGRGLLAAAYVLPNIVGIFAALGLEMATVYFIGKNPDDAKRLASTAFWSVLGLGVVMALAIHVAYAQIPALINAEVSPFLRTIILAQLPLAMVATLTSAFFTHRRWFGRRYVLDILRRVLNVAGLAIIALVVFPHSPPVDLVETIGVVHLGVALFAFGLSVYFMRDWLLGRPSLALFRTLLGFGWANSIAVSAMFLLHYGDQFLIAMIGGQSAISMLGIYTTAFALLAAVTGISRSISAVMIRESVESSAEESNLRLPALARRTTLLSLAFAILAAIFTPILVLMLPAEFAPIGICLPILLISAPLYAMSQIAEQVTVNRGRFLVGAWPALLAVVLNIGLNLWWIPIYGIFGAAWATVAAFALLLIGRLLIVRRLAGPAVLRGFVAINFEDVRFLRRKLVEMLGRRRDS